MGQGAKSVQALVGMMGASEGLKCGQRHGVGHHRVPGHSGPCREKVRPEAERAEKALVVRQLPGG